MRSRRPRRVGHKGAAHIEPGNTLASFDAALRHGVDMIELDVLSEHADGSGRLLVAHDYEDMRARTPLTFEQALEHLAGERFAGIELDVDVKLPGYELRVLEALRELGLVARTLISGMFPAGAGARSARPSRRCASAGRCRACAATTPPTCSPRSPRSRSSPATARCCRAARARRCSRALRRDHGALARGHRRARARGAPTAAAQLYVWTVDDARMIAKLTAMGVDGIITNDPRLFERRCASQRARGRAEARLGSRARRG